jgi:hypothetical protein
MTNLEASLATLDRHRESGVVIDTQLLLLLLIGGFDRELIGRFKRVRHYEEADFDLLAVLVERCPKLFTTPSVLTEVMNLAGQLPEETAFLFRQAVRRVIPGWQERHVAAAQLAEGEAFARLGLTDATLEELARSNVLVLTDDHPLFGRLTEQDLPAMNFTHLRAELR